MGHLCGGVQKDLNKSSLLHDCHNLSRWRGTEFYVGLAILVVSVHSLSLSWSLAYTLICSTGS